MNQLFASLKRLFEPRARPADTTEQPPADRPPPLEPESRVAPAAADVVPAAEDVAEPPEPVASASPPAPEPAQLFPEASTEEVVDVPSEVVDRPIAAPDRVGDALVLTLATPATTFTVAKAAATIGRGQENTIRLDDLSVSRRHARIAYKQGGYWLSDLGSMGGTWVDGTRLNAPQRIETGQIIDIGLCRLTVNSVGGPAKAESRSAR